MSKEKVLEARGAEFDATVRLARAAAAIGKAQEGLKAARDEYDAAQVEVGNLKGAAERVQREAVEAETGVKALDVAEPARDRSMR